MGKEALQSLRVPLLPVCLHSVIVCIASFMLVFPDPPWQRGLRCSPGPQGSQLGSGSVGASTPLLGATNAPPVSLAELTKECPSDQRKSPSMVLSFRPIHW